MMNLLKSFFGAPARKDRPISAEVGKLALAAYQKREAYLLCQSPAGGATCAERGKRSYAREQARAEMVEANQKLRKAQGFGPPPRPAPPWPCPRHG